MIKESIMKLSQGADLTEEEAEITMNEIMNGEATPAQIASFLTALRMKGESVPEITGCAKAMKGKAVKVTPEVDTIVDTCGTGGDGKNTFNISTTAAFVVAGAGLAVAKHGNRSASGKCGSADVLEALGININLGPDQVRRCIENVGIGFLFAPLFHSAMKHAVGPRREIGIRTVFNILGPLTNPANANAQVLGVYEPSLTEAIAMVLARMGTRRAFVVHGLDGMDELSITRESRVSEVEVGNVKTYEISPEDLGMKRCSIEELQGGDAPDNATVVLRILNGEERGPRRDVVLLNAAAAIVSGGKAPDLMTGLEIARESIDSGRALQKLYELREASWQPA